MIAMEPGGSAALSEDIVPPGESLNQQRHILNAPTPDGTMELFIVEISSPEYPDGRSCEAVAFPDGGNAVIGCLVADDALDESEQLRVHELFQRDGQAAFLLAGPQGATHFILDKDDTRLAIIPREGYSLVTISGATCPGESGRIEAWRESELLSSQDEVGFC